MLFTFQNNVIYQMRHVLTLGSFNFKSTQKTLFLACEGKTTDKMIIGRIITTRFSASYVIIMHMNKTYFTQTMGCQMNERDSETIAGMLEEMGFSKAAAKADADVIIINTCSIRDNADKKFFGILGQLKKVKLDSPETLIAVCGCMMQQQHITDRIKAKYSWVDIVFGTHNIHTLPELLKKAHEENAKIVSVLPYREELIEGLPAKREYDYKAYVNIMYGCNNFCTYCIVPYTRGREVSRDPEQIFAEVKALAESGTKEITLLGQNVNSYAGGNLDFADLIEMLESIEGIERIRFMTSHPKDFSDKLAALYGKSKKLCPSLHLPVQSGSSRILAKMNRKYDREKYINHIEAVRKICPNIVVTTDFIVGFPGETEDDFKYTMDLIETVRFDSAFTFIFSPRPGTPAAEYDEQIPEETKHERFNRMIDRLNAITLEKNKLYIGRIEKVLVENLSKTNKGMLSGRTEGGKLVNFKGADKAIDSQIGQIVKVKINDVNTFSFIGELIEE